MEAYFSSINRSGGVNGRKIDYGTPFDGQSTESGDSTAIRGALAEKPNEIVGLVAFLQGATDLLKAAKIPVVAAQVPDPSWALTKPFPWYYNPIGDTVGPFVQGFKSLLGGSLQGKKIDFISLNFPTEVGLVDATEKDVKAQGGTSPVTKLVDVTQLSFSSEASAIAADHPAGVAMNLLGAGPRQVAQDLADDGYHGPIISWEPAADPATISSIGLSNYYGERYFPLPGAATPPEKAAAAAGIPRNSQADLDQGWVNGAIAVTGLRACKTASCSPSDVESALNTTPISAPGVLFAPMSYSATNHSGNITYGFYHYDPVTKDIVLSGSPVYVDSDKIGQYYGLGG